jgi:hypothetical protein
MPAGETKAGSWGCVGRPALVPDAAICSLNGFTDRALQAFAREYVFESDCSRAHLDNSSARGATQDVAANLTCVN